MPAPPGVMPAADARRNYVSEERGPIGHALIQRLVNEARRHPECAALSTNRISRAVRAYITSTDRERDLIGWVIAYADPTGETAVRHVIKERGW